MINLKDQKVRKIGQLACMGNSLVYYVNACLNILSFIKRDVVIRARPEAYVNLNQ